MSKPKEAYEIGFCKPPRTHQFQPGQSGNPRGRPKGSKTLTTLIREISQQKVRVKDGDGHRYVPKVELAVTQLSNSAATGNLKAIDLLLRLLQSLPEDAKPNYVMPGLVIQFVDPEIDRQYRSHQTLTSSMPDRSEDLDEGG